MGEYIEIGLGNSVKIGTCENLYYARLSDLQKLQERGFHVSEYLNPANGFRYRFPFPEEDGTKIGTYEPYEKGLMVHLDSRYAPKLYESLYTDWEHYTICHSQGVGGSGCYNVNIIFPCPLSPKFPKTGEVKLSQGGASAVIQIVQLKQVEDEVWTVIECGYCGARVRLPKEEALEVVECLHHYDNIEDRQSYYNKVADRILEGYK